ncbi:MAG: hypothetical protein GC164_03430 [Phycisphaera sp.]|nr:hypothetical protein [Phycisphaera sp.]
MTPGSQTPGSQTPGSQYPGSLNPGSPIQPIGRPLGALVLFSPGVIVGINLLIAAAAWVYPPRWYSDVIDEPNYIYHNGPAALFIALCVVTFAVGYLMATPYTRRQHTIHQHPLSPDTAGLLAELALCGCLVLGHLLVFYKLMNAMPLGELLGAMTGSFKGSEVRETLSDVLANQNIGFITVLGRAMIPWLVWVGLRKGRTVSWLLRLGYWLLVGMLIATYLVDMVLVGGRGSALLPVFSLVVVWALHRWCRGGLPFVRTAAVLLLALAIAVGFFAMVTNTRRGIPVEEWSIAPATNDAVAYYLGSYNRFGAAIDGKLNMPGQGGGYYWTQWLWEFPFLKHTLPLEHLAHDTLTQGVAQDWSEVTLPVRNAGLDGQYTSLTIFTHSFVDFGWWGFLPFVFYGVLTAFTWRWFREGRFIGVSLYPFVLWSLLEWRGYIEITRAANGYILVGMLMFILAKPVERALMVRRSPGSPAQAEQRGVA